MLAKNMLLLHFTLTKIYEAIAYIVHICWRSCRNVSIFTALLIHRHLQHTPDMLCNIRVCTFIYPQHLTRFVININRRHLSLPSQCTSIPFFSALSCYISHLCPILCTPPTLTATLLSTVSLRLSFFLSLFISSKFVLPNYKLISLFHFHLSSVSWVPLP